MTKVARLTASEKLAVNLLRGANGHDGLKCAEGPFDTLADRARAEGLRIQSSDCRYLGQDEVKLLAALTLSQRRRAELLVDVESALHPDLHRCATVLADAGVWLDYRNMLRASAAARRHIEIATIASAWVKHSSIDDPFAKFAVQAELYRYVTAHGTVWFKELQTLGATRHLVATMCKHGLLRRVRHGVYEVPRELIGERTPA